MEATYALIFEFYFSRLINFKENGGLNMKFIEIKGRILI